ncbi:MAG TPA: thrombospondin type 3 repeat-containing protein, partial [Candidatus Polarisedimenticolia bacterium]|nr:thrombospondin type 3 repeat-containing protein [Candidatus Polarisedimenticolia bacterium]
MSTTRSRINRLAILLVTTICSLYAGHASAQVRDNCEDALIVAPGTRLGFTRFNTTDGSASCEGPGSNPDVWYRYTPCAAGTLVVDVTGSCDAFGCFFPVVSLHPGCPGTSANELACNAGIGGLQSRVTIPVTPGVPVLIRVSGQIGPAATISNFTLTLTGPPISGADQDGDGVCDSGDNCPGVFNTDQDNGDGDSLGDACDPFPDLDLKVRPVGPDFAFVDEPAPHLFRLEDPQGNLLTDLAGVRTTLTLDGSAAYGALATQGLLLEGGGTSRALVEFVGGIVEIEIFDSAEEVVTLGGEDTENIGIEVIAVPDSFVEDFEDGDLGDYSVVSGSLDTFSTAGAAAHDGVLGLTIEGTGWAFRDDPDVRTAQGDIISVWVNLGSNLDGRAYFGFGASSGGTMSLVAAANTGQLLLQDNPGYGFLTLNSSPQAWQANKWYRLEVMWGAGGALVGNLYDSDGQTLINTVSATRNTVMAGGISFRGVTAGSGIHFDTVALGPYGLKTIGFLDPFGDPDADGLNNTDELALGTDPLNPDTDHDTVLDGSDNCPLTPNTDQSDEVHPSGMGDACDDPDGDGVFDDADNCPDTSNADQLDEDNDGSGDVCDFDADNDGVPNSGDNCPAIFNPGQFD